MHDSIFFNKKSLLLFAALLALLGIADASYVIYHALRQLPLPCPILDGCKTVLASPHSKVFGIPLSLFGVLYYLLIFISSLAYFFRKTWFFPKNILALSGIGFLFAVYYLYVQAFIIKAFCIYCIFSAVVSTLLLLVSLFLLRDALPEGR